MADYFNLKKLLAAKDQTISIQNDLINHQKAQIDELVKTLARLVPEPVHLKPYDEEANRPLTFDETENKFRPKTDEEINRDIKGFQELGIF